MALKEVYFTAIWGQMDKLKYFLKVVASHWVEGYVNYATQHKNAKKEILCEFKDTFILQKK